MSLSTTITTTLKPTLLTLPRELRNEIYTHLFLPSHTYFITPRLNPYDLSFLAPIESIYIEDEIFLPICPPLNLLHTCAQTRHEVLEQTALAFNSPHARHQPRGTATPPLLSSSSPNSSVAPATTTSNATSDTSTDVDNAAAPVTLTVRRRTPFRGSWSNYFPARTAFSPRFYALLPLLTLPKRLHFTIWAGWAGWSWWNKPSLTRTSTLLSSSAHTVARRVSYDKTDCVKMMPERDMLRWVLGKVLGCLSGVEEVEVEIRMLAWEYWNWGSPTPWWEGMEERLRGPDGNWDWDRDGDWDWDRDGDGDSGRRRWRRVETRLVAYDTMEEGGKKVVFFRKEEIWGGGGREGDGNGGKGAEVLVTEETAKVPRTSNKWDAIEYISRTYTRRE